MGKIVPQAKQAGMKNLEQISSKLKELQERTCSKIENNDGSGRFTKDEWTKDIGYGITRVISKGHKIEKGAVNFSKVSGPLSEKMTRLLDVEGERFSATGMSSIFHGTNPYIPSIHMNVRYFSLDNGVEWFGGCFDLTPVYIDREEAREFHRRLKAVCDQYHNRFYPDFKKWADDYFFLPHRNETRGVGGIFFDRQQPGKKINFAQWVQFITDLARLYPDIYVKFMNNNAHKPYNDRHRLWQKIRWGRYVEFNLIYDRGTRFGIESGGNTESILISLPPEVRWEYNFRADAGTEEDQTQRLLHKDIDWICDTNHQ